MKKLFIALVVCAMICLSGCCAMVTTPVSGFIYSNVKSPISVTGNGEASKSGSATVTSILGWFATGDASINAAAKAGGITKIHHVDAHAESILGIVARYTVTVYGE